MITLSTVAKQTDAGFMHVRKLPIPNWEVLLRLTQAKTFLPLGIFAALIPLVARFLDALSPTLRIISPRWSLLCLGGFSYSLALVLLNMWLPGVLDWQRRHGRQALPDWVLAAKFLTELFSEERVWLSNTRFAPAEEAAQDLWNRLQGEDGIYGFGKSAWETEVAGVERLELIIRKESNRHDALLLAELVSTWSRFFKRLAVLFFLLVSIVCIAIIYVVNLWVVLKHTAIGPG